MEIYVDADACPVVEDVVELAGDRPVHLVHNQHHQIEHDAANVTVHVCGDRRDQADHLIYNLCGEGDLVVTDDLGLAALVLSSGSRVVRFRGDRPTNQDIDTALELRHAAAQERRKNRRSGGGPSEYTEADRRKFRRAFQDLIETE